MRIISLVPSITETLFELGLGDQIVAVTRWCTRPADLVKTKRIVGGTKNPKIDVLFSLNPDIVIMDCDENRKRDAEELERRGIHTCSFFPKTIEDSIQLIQDLGKMFSVETKATELVNEIQKRLDYKPLRRLETLILIWRSPYMTINSDTYVHSICKFFGFENIFRSHAVRYPELSAKEIEAADPEMILFPDEPYPFREKHMEMFAKEFPYVRGVLRKQMLYFDGSYIAWHGFGTLRALREFPALLGVHRA